VQVSDDALKSRVEQALRADPARQDSQIAVPSVHQGVRRVAGEVHSPHTLADAEIWREPTPHQPRETYGVREAASDRRITPETKMRLLADSQTPALAINVDTRSGVVTLFGIVPSQKAKAAVAADGRARHLGRAGGQG
jgi:osmotically-inducible protein OsmY